jgi:hypothetical protein
MTDQLEDVEWMCSCGHSLPEHPPEEVGEDFVHRCEVEGCTCEGYQEAEA